MWCGLVWPQDIGKARGYRSMQAVAHTVVVLVLKYAVALLFEVEASGPLGSGSWRRAVHSTCPQCLLSAGLMFYPLKKSLHQKRRSPHRNSAGSARAPFFLFFFFLNVWSSWIPFCFIRPVLLSLQKYLQWGCMVFSETRTEDYWMWQLDLADFT